MFGINITQTKDNRIHIKIYDKKLINQLKGYNYAGVIVITTTQHNQIKDEVIKINLLKNKLLNTNKIENKNDYYLIRKIVDINYLNVDSYKLIGNQLIINLKSAITNHEILMQNKNVQCSKPNIDDIAKEYIGGLYNRMAGGIIDKTYEKTVISNVILGFVEYSKAKGIK